MGTPSQRVDGYFHTHDGNLPTSAFDASPEALAVLDHGRILHANPAFGALFGSNAPQEMLGCAYVRSSSPAQSCSQSSSEEKAWASNGHPLCRFRETKLD